ncbi:hypothetical protein GCM10023156_30680 [Novipirellula rosea]|uniref:Glycosyl transferase family 1 domain-containing protein n=2 Tax=Novipirellula rosea TaxID=1031540 RepID=A0ABP8MTQ0_9BACT
MNAVLRAGVKVTQRHADAVVYISRTVAKSYGEPTNTDGSQKNLRRSVIYNGLNIDSITASADRAGARTPQQLVSVGRLAPVKGHRMVIEALPELAKSFPLIRYTIIGEGNERENLMSLAHRLGVSKRVHLLGWLSHADAIAEMARSAAVIMPTRDNEGFGLALVEAVLSGSPVVASTIPVFKEIANRGIRGIHFFTNNDVASLAKAVTKVLAQPMAPDAIANSREQVRKEFSAKEMSRHYFAIYQQTISQGR